MNEDFLLDSYDYELPEKSIAQHPLDTPGSSRLLVMNRDAAYHGAEPGLKDALFSDLPSLLPENSFLVANNAKVLPARIKWRRPGGGKAEFLLLTPLPVLEASSSRDDQAWRKATAEALLKPGAKFRPGQHLRICENLEGTIQDKAEYGRHLLELRWRGSLEKIFDQQGALPLPPYIRREEVWADKERYQTIYASRSGAVAAPTAGLHFTPELRKTLSGGSFSWEELTLYVGYGTFSPVRCANIQEHSMHREYVEISAKAAQQINEAIGSGRPIIAVGTTSLRALEGVALLCGQIREFAGWIDIFIYPGFDFKIVGGLITNFHLPKSSLLMLASAFAGRKRILAAYAHALKNSYRFYSYGDAMLIR